MFKLTNSNICIKEIDHSQECDKKVDYLVTRELSIYKSVHLKAFQCPRNAKLLQANVLELPEIFFNVKIIPCTPSYSQNLFVLFQQLSLEERPSPRHFKKTPDIVETAHLKT